MRIAGNDWPRDAQELHLHGCAVLTGPPSEWNLPVTLGCLHSSQELAIRLIGLGAR